MVSTWVRLYWNPRFRVLRHPGYGVFLLGENTSFHLPFHDYPWLREVDADVDTAVIGTQLAPAARPMFFFQIDRLSAEGYLLPADPMDGGRRIASPSSVIPECRTMKGRREIVTQSAAAADFRETWIELVTPFAAHDNSVSMYLVDDFYQARVAVPARDFMVIKIVGEILWFSPVIASTDFNLWLWLQRRTTDNQPVRRFCERELPTQAHYIPYEYDADRIHSRRETIRSIIHDQVNDRVAHLQCMNLRSGTMSAHPVAAQPPLLIPDGMSMRDSGARDSGSQDSCLQENGVRLVPPEITYQKLAHLVDSFTGLTPQLARIATETPAVHVYRSCFYKTPFRPSGRVFHQDDFLQICLGKGASAAQAKVSALGELIERSAALYRGDEPLVFSSMAELCGRKFSYQSLTPFSHAQYSAFARAGVESIHIQKVKPYAGSRIPWLQLKSMTRHEQVYVPASLLLSNMPVDAADFGVWNSNGCAAGNSVEEAVLQAILELIERDATAIWWYNKLQRGSLNPRDYPFAAQGPLLEHIEGRYDFHLLNLTHDLGVPVAAAVGRRKHGGGLCLGFGCHLDPAIAVQRALTEFCQLDALELRKSHYFDFGKIPDEPYLMPGDSPEVLSKPAGGRGIGENLRFLLAALAQAHLEALVYCYPRSDLPLRAVKVFIPGLCHVWPQFANERLYQVPVALGLSPGCRAESDLNPIGLNI